MSKPELTQERLRSLLDYNPETGIFRWKVSGRGHRAGAVAGGRSSSYWKIGIDGRRYGAHRLAWFHNKGEWPATELDHRDLNKEHNAISNLRPASRSQNLANQRMHSNNKAGFKGVSPKRGRFCAQIQKNGKNIHLGYFETPEDAHQCYMGAARYLFGEFALA